MPIAFETGPVSAKDTGVRPIETNQSRRVHAAAQLAAARAWT